MTHHRDIRTEDLEAMLQLTRHPEDLRLLVAHANRTIGFFPAHNPRALEHPWVLASLGAELCGLRILDVGAGVNPLPFALAERGATVTTLDNHPLTRTGQPRAEWNEWGYLDYSSIDARISSERCPYEQFKPDTLFDCIYSVSVIEHVPATVRRLDRQPLAATYSRRPAPADRRPYS